MFCGNPLRGKRTHYCSNICGVKMRNTHNREDWEEVYDKPGDARYLDEFLARLRRSGRMHVDVVFSRRTNG